VPVAAVEPAVDDGDVGPELADAGRVEPADLELDDDVAQLLDQAQQGIPTSQFKVRPASGDVC